MITKVALVLIYSLLLVVADEIEDVYETEVPSTHVPHIMSSSLKVDATMGESVTFPCAVDDLGDFVLLWKAGNKVLFAVPLKISRDKRIEIVDETSLFIAGVQPEDNGNYSCQISTNPLTELTHSLNVLYPPSVIPVPVSGEVQAKEGEKVILSCNATGNPTPWITWKHMGRNYESTNKINYILNNVQKSDSGEYECIAHNGVGDPDSAIITVDVVSAPKISPHPQSGHLTVKEGEPVFISCEASGDPTPMITWEKPFEGKSHNDIDGHKINITAANRSHAGSYECVANNSLGIFTSFKIEVEVQYAPEIKVPMQQLHTGEEIPVELTCIVHGDPPPSVAWKKEDHVLHSNDHYHMKSEGKHKHVLVIRHMKESDFGHYECSAKNSLGSASETVDVMGTPKVPSFTSKPHGSQGTKYTLSWKVESHSPIDAYSLRYKKKSQGEEWVPLEVLPNPIDEEGHHLHTQMYQLTDLDPSTTYEAVVIAHNKFGLSEESETFEFQTKAEVSSTAMTMEPTIAASVVMEGTSNTNGKAPPGDGTDTATSCHVSFLALVTQVLALCIWRPLLL